MESNKPKTEAPIKFLKIIWFTFVTSIVFFGFAAFTTVQVANEVSGSEVSEKVALTENALFYPMVAWSLFAVILAFSIPKFLINFLLASRKRQRQVEEKLLVPDWLALHASGSQQISDQTVEYIFAFILRMVLFESIAMCGFVLSISTHRFESYLYFSTLAVVLFFINYPTLENFNKTLHASLSDRNRQQ